jgi:hypothetical protein
MLLSPSKKFTANTASLPSPIGGWNARDSLANMAPTDAVQLTNWFPTPTDVSLRKGYTKISTGITGTVETLMNYAGVSFQKLFAVANGVIYDTSTSVATSVFTGLSNSRFQFSNITTAGGHFLVACNGADPTIIYDGSVWFKVATTTTAQTISTITRGGAGNLTATVTTAVAHGLATGNRVTISGAAPTQYNGTYVITVTGATTFTYTMVSAPATNATVVGTYSIIGITGINSNTFINVNLFKNRLYFTEENSMNVWYLDVDSIGGVAEVLPYGSIARNGGFVQAVGTWTLDAGQGADDYFVVVTNMGEIIVINGTDPTAPETWQLKGVWQMGQTYTRNCFFKFGGDLLLLTQDGIVPMSAALQSSRLDPRVNITDKIYYAVSQAATQYYDNFGWQIQYFASENMLIFNVPVTGGIQQYVMHTITKSWANFTGLEASCWEVNGKEGMYFGGNGYVAKFYDGFSDAGNNINATAQQAYNYFDARGQLKRFTMLRPIIQSDNAVPSLSIGLNIDFDNNNVNGTLTFNPSNLTTGRWDTATWDDDVWGGGLTTTKYWQGVSGLGYAAGINLTAASQNIEVHWSSTDVVMEKGGVL